MKVALITTYNPAGIGARYLAATLRRAGHQALIIHFKELRAVEVPNDQRQLHHSLQHGDILSVFSYRPGRKCYSPYPTPVTDRERDLLLEELRAFAPDLVGFSLNSVTYTLVAQLTDLVRKCLPSTPIIWGGVHPIIMPEQCIEHADIICSGEGEEVTRLLLENWEDYQRTGHLDIPGLWFRTPERIYASPIHPIIEDMDTLPLPSLAENELLIEDDRVDRERFMQPGEYINNTISIFTARGCPYKCTYCVYSSPHFRQSGHYRRRSVDHVLAEFHDRVTRLGMRHFVVPDEIFVMGRDWLYEFARRFKQEFYQKWGVTFGGYVHPLHSTKEMVDFLVDAGMSVVGLGIQSGSQYVTKKIYHRPWVPERFFELSYLLSQYEWKYIQYDLLSNNACENEDHMRETFKFLLNLFPPFHPEVFQLVIYPGSVINQMPPGPYQHDDKTLTFWHMLYHLTGIRGIDRDQLLRWSNDPVLREHPQVLEQLTAALYKLHNRFHELNWELKILHSNSTHPSPPLPLPTTVRLLKRLLPARLRHQARQLLDSSVSTAKHGKG